MLSTQESPSREGDGLLFTYGKGIFGRLGHGIKDSYTLSEKSKLLPSRVGSKPVPGFAMHRDSLRQA